jgi:hypothetical protein
MKCRSNASELWAITIIWLTQGRGSQRYLHDRPRTSVSYRSNPVRHRPRSRIAKRTVACIPTCTLAYWYVWYSALFQNRRIHTVLCRLVETRSSTAAYNIYLCTLCMSHKSACHIRVFCLEWRVRRIICIFACAHSHFISTSSLMIVETSLAPKMSFSPRTGFEPLTIRMADSTCSRYMSDRKCAWYRDDTPCRTLYIHPSAMAAFRFPITLCHFVIQ